MSAACRVFARHSPDFVAAWRSVFCGVYRWRQDGRFAVVPSLLGSPVFAYLPGLNSSDLDAAEARQLAGEMQGRSFNIRALAPPQAALLPGAPAVLRLDLAAFGHDREVVWKQGLKKTAREAVRQAHRAGLVAQEETGVAAIEGLCAMLRLVAMRHGAPMLPVALFEAVVQDMGARIVVVRNRADGRPRASLLWLRDGPLAWAPWAGAYVGASRSGNLLAWTLVEQAINEGADIIDFGRSPIGGGADRFKRSFGATPIPVLWLSDTSADLYRRYTLAQKLWRGLPNFVSDRVGPRLCRYLADY